MYDKKCLLKLLKANTNGQARSQKGHSQIGIFLSDFELPFDMCLFFVMDLERVAGFNGALAGTESLELDRAFRTRLHMSTSQ